jgi:eukaryotic-like serine/threonine-protein kinase
VTADHDQSSAKRRAVLGQTFGAYTFFHVIAEGGMGVIFEAKHNATGRRLALKVVNPKYAAREGFSPALVETFLAEARVMAAIEHVNVVTLYDAGVVGQCPYLAMRLVPGGDLAGRVQKHGPITDHGEVLALMAGIADGIGAFHRAGYLNRDVKPANILLELDGSPRIADFGLALRQDEEPQPGEIAGTPSYLAPEQVRQEALTPQTDLFALGATMFFAVTGRPPFDGPTPEAIAAEVAQAIAPPFLDLGDDPRGQGLADIIRHCMEVAPDDRYRSASQVVADCWSVLGGRDPEFCGSRPRRRRSGSFLANLFKPGTAPPA